MDRNGPERTAKLGAWSANQTPKGGIPAGQQPALRYTAQSMTPEELTRRLSEADRRRVALRRATLELMALGRQALKERGERKGDLANRSERPRRGSARRPSGV
jgi:hypothetical protein